MCAEIQNDALLLHSETPLRGTMMSLSDISFSLGTFIVIALGAIFSWRQVSLMCALSPICCIAAILFVISNGIDNFDKKNKERIKLMHLKFIFTKWVRFLNRHHGCCQWVEKRMHKNRCNGYAVACRHKQFAMNLRRCKIITIIAIHQMRAPHAQRNPFIASMRNRHFGRISEKSSDIVER